MHYDESMLHYSYKFAETIKKVKYEIKSDNFERENHWVYKNDKTATKETRKVKKKDKEKNIHSFVYHFGQRVCLLCQLSPAIVEANLKDCTN